MKGIMNRTKEITSVICALTLSLTACHRGVRARTPRHWAHVQRIKTRLGTVATGPARRAECDLPGAGRRRLRAARLLRLGDSDAEYRSAGGGRTALHQLSHHGAVLAVARVPC